MDTASLQGLIKTLFYILLFYYLFKFLMRLLAPYLVQQMAKKAEEHIKKQFDQQQQNYHTHNQNQTQTELKKATPKPTKQVGEYIDFEEVE